VLARIKKRGGTKKVHAEEPSNDMYSTADRRDQGREKPRRLLGLLRVVSANI
jgi:hypothetical protein